MIFLCGGLHTAGAALAQDAKIFILHSYHQEYPWTSNENQGFTRTLLDKLPHTNISFSTEYLDTKRITFEPDYQQFFFRYLKQKYSNYAPDVIFSTDDNALTFLLQFKESLFGDAPVIFCGVNNLHVEQDLHRQEYTGVFERKEIAPNLDLLPTFNIQPDSIIFLGDGSSTHEAIVHEIKPDLAARYPTQQYTILSGNDLASLIRQLQLYKTGVIFLTTIGEIKDEHGSVLTLQKILASIVGAGNFTVISMEDVYLAEGILGGYVTSGISQGQEAANLVVQVLQGSSPAALPLITKSPNEFIFNYPQLKKLGLPLAKLPATSIILNRPHSYYEQYKRRVWFFLSFLILQVIVIFTLLWNISRRKTAERSVQMARDKLEEQVIKRTQELTERNKLLHQAQLKAQNYLDIVKVMLVGLDRDGVVTLINREGCRILGAPENEIIGKNWFETFIPESERPTLKKIHSELYQLLFLGEGEFPEYYENFVLRKNGEQCLIAWNNSIIKNERGETVASLSSGVDITERRMAEKKLQQEQMKAQKYLDVAGVMLGALNVRGEITLINNQGCKILNVSEQDVLGKNWFDQFLPKEIVAEVRGVFNRLMSGRLELVEFYENPVLTGDGRERIIAFHNTLLRDDRGEIEGILFSGEDITLRKQSEKQLQQSAIVFENTKDGVIITDPAVRITAVNQAFTEITGYTEEEVQGKNPNILKSDMQSPDFYAEMWSSIKESRYWQGEIWNRRKNGQIYAEWLTISTVFDLSGNITNYIAVFSDISQMKESEQKLKQLAHYDSLTGLPNRLLMHARLVHALERTQRKDSKIAILFLDLDHFKNINDSLGHPAGDEVLQATAKRLAQRVREEDTLARLGGDEFVILLEHLEKAESAAIVAQDLLYLFSKPFILADKQEVYLGASIGISLFPDDGKSATQLIQHADAAMYEAKNAGRNTYRFYMQEMTIAANERLLMEMELRRALERDEFIVHFQPQVEIVSSKIIGLEAMVRWQHPQLGLVPPNKFIGVAEDSGLIGPLGEWVLQTACRQILAMDRKGMPPLKLAVNLYIRQFFQENLVQRISEILAETGLDPRRLELEITETMMMEKRISWMNMLEGLKKLGVSLAIDDFGIGYSSLAYLKQFDIDTLKIDRSFIANIPTISSDKEIVSTIITMARNLNLQVVAEGVETEEQLNFLREHGCNAYQGYLHSRPLPAEELVELLLHGKPGSGTGRS
jgi:diguanylate cyclase (GGDEF)-like protein/PAS domain S-box-containing protein